VDDDGAEEALTNELQRLAQDLSTDAAQQRAEQLGAAKARGLAVEGAARTRRALGMGAVETLLLEYDRSAAGEGELLAASVRTDAEAALIDSQVEDGIAAILRFEVPDQ
jgi:peptide subunit release factor 1 (eRF1)